MGSDAPKADIELAGSVALGGALALVAAEIGLVDPHVIGIAAGAAGSLQVLVPAAVRTIQVRAAAIWQTVRHAEAAAQRPIDELLAGAEDSIVKTQLTSDVLEAAARSACAEKIAALGRSWAVGLVASTEVEAEYERVLVGALARLESAHIRVLRRIATSHRQSSAADNRDQIFNSGWTLSHLGRVEQELAGMVETLVGTLDGAGLVKLADRSTGTMGSVDEGYRLTQLGRQIIATLDAAATDAPLGQ